MPSAASSSRPPVKEKPRLGSLTFEMEIVDPIPILEKLQHIRKDSDDAFVTLVDTCARCFEKMRNLQVELQSKLILTNVPPEVWREQWDETQLEMLNLHGLLFHKENSYQASLNTLNIQRRNCLAKHDAHWDFIIKEFSRWATCLIKLSHRYYIVEDEINSRGKELLEQYTKIRAQLEYATTTLDNARKGVDLITQAKWTNDEALLQKYENGSILIQKIVRGHQTRKFMTTLRHSIVFMRYYVKRFLVKFRRELMLRKKCVPYLIKVQAHCRRHLAKKIVAARMNEVCGPIAERLNPLLKRYYYDTCWMENTVLAGWEESTLTMQRLFRGFRGRKRARRAQEKKRKEEAERARLKAMAQADRDAEETKRKMREEEKARKKAEAEFAAAQAKRAEMRAQAEKEERERLALEEHLKQERRKQEAIERRKAEQEEKLRKKDEIEKKREVMRRNLEKQRKIQAERENNRKDIAREALAEQRREYREKLAADREQRKQEEVDRENARLESEALKRAKLQWLNRPWRGDEEEIAEFREWFFSKWGALGPGGLAEAPLQLLQYRSTKAFQFLDREVAEVLPAPGFLVKKFTELLCMKLKYCLEIRAVQLFQVLDRGSGGTGLIPVDVILGEARPSPREPAGLAELQKFKRTSALNAAIIELSKQTPLVLEPGDAPPAENPPAVCFRPGIEQPDVFFTTAFWVISNFARFISEKKEDFMTDKSSSGGGVAALRSGKRLSPFLEDPKASAVAGNLMRRDRREMKQRRGGRGQASARNRSADPDINKDDSSPVQAAEGAAAAVPVSPEVAPGVSSKNNEDRGPFASDSSPGSPSSPEQGHSKSPLQTQRTARAAASPRHGATNFVPEDLSSLSEYSEEDEENEAQQPSSSTKQKEITLRCKAFTVDDILVEIEMRVSNPRKTNKRHLSMFLRAAKSVHVRVVFYVENTIGLPKDLKFERSSDILGERKFLDDYCDEYSVKLSNDELDALAGEPFGEGAGGEQNKGAGNLLPGAVEAAAAPAGPGPTAAAAGPTTAKSDLAVGFVLLQDLKARPDPVLVFDHPQDRSKQVVKWLPQLRLEFLLQYYPRGVGIKSPPFKIGRDGPFMLEFWPRGSTNATKTGNCSICLHAPRLKNAVCNVQFWACELDCFVEDNTLSKEKLPGDDLLAETAEQKAKLTQRDMALDSSGGGNANNKSARKRILSKDKEYRLEYTAAAPSIGLGAGSSSSSAYRPSDRVATVSGATSRAENKCMLDEFCATTDVALEEDQHGGRSVVLGCVFKRLVVEAQKDKLKSLAAGLDVGSIAFNF
ncbi:unnamed protein product [Amoebophrya sp. A120]|nr:unnamed protein product [Amoebophrya sp. A120]|eukprot:GSA120T00008243001.1